MGGVAQKRPILILCAMDVNWARDYLLARHPLGAQLPLAVALIVLFATWRGARESLGRTRTATRWILGAAVIAGAIMLAMAIQYARVYTFLDHVEPNVVGIAEMFATGRPIYHPLDSAERYALLYGPNLFILYGMLLKLTGSSIPALKVFVILGFIATLAVAWLACRRASNRMMANIAVAFLVAAIASYGDLPIWVRAEPALMLLTAIGFLAALTLGPIRGAIAIGLCAGLIVNVKAHAPLYLVTAWMLFPHRWKIVPLLIAAVTTLIVAVLPFVLFRHEVSLELYRTWLGEAAKHGLNRSFLARNVEVLIYLSAPAVVTVAALTVINPSALRRWLREQTAFAVALVGCGGAVAVIASKPGAGPWHLMPLLIPLGYAIARAGHLLSSETPPEASPRERPFFVALAQGVIASFALVAIASAGSRAGRVFEEIDPATDRAIVAELRQNVSEHPGAHVILGVASGAPDPRLDFYRPVLLGLGQPYLLDYAAVMDMKLSGIPLPDATRRAMLDDPSAIWLFPRGKEPFSIASVYNPSERVFDEALRVAFQRDFARTRSTQYFDIWARHGAVPSPASGP